MGNLFKKTKLSNNLPLDAKQVEQKEEMSEHMKKINSIGRNVINKFGLTKKDIELVKKTYEELKNEI